MPNGRSANVRSHRRGGGLGRLSPWLVIGVVVVLVAGGVVVGWRYVAPHPCTGSDTAVIDAAPDIAPILSQLNTQWAKTKPEVKGTCVSATVTPKDSALMATLLGYPWKTQTSGPAPDVWVPESSVWIQQASNREDAQVLMPELQPSLARSPNVIAMPKDMAVALGWPNTKFDWPDIVTDVSKPDFWKSKNKAWGSFKFTMTKPDASTAGMLTLMSVADRNDDGSVTVDPADTKDDEQQWIINLAQALRSHPSVGDSVDVLNGLSKADTTSAAAATSYVSAFPALEQDVIKYNESDPKEPLVAVYPTSGSYDADNPYLILNHPTWGTAASLTAATAFENYVRSPAARAVFLKAGFRDANRNGDASFNQAAGVLNSLTTSDLLPRPVLDPASVQAALQRWNAASSEPNVLLTLDISASMDNVVPGTGGKTRLQLAQKAALNALDQFDPGSSVGLWVFSSNLEGTRAYRSLVTLGPLNASGSGGGTRKAQLRSAITALKAKGNTGLYNTIDAAQKSVEANFVTGSTNFVVVITDGDDDPEGAPGTPEVDLNELETDLTHIYNTAKNVPIVTIGIGKLASSKLAEISRVSGGASFDSTGFDIDSVLESALFGPANRS